MLLLVWGEADDGRSHLYEAQIKRKRSAEDDDMEEEEELEDQ